MRGYVTVMIVFWLCLLSWMCRAETEVKQLRVGEADTIIHCSVRLLVFVTCDTTIVMAVEWPIDVIPSKCMINGKTVTPRYECKKSGAILRWVNGRSIKGPCSHPECAPCEPLVVHFLCRPSIGKHRCDTIPVGYDNGVRRKPFCKFHKKDCAPEPCECTCKNQWRKDLDAWRKLVQEIDYNDGITCKCCGGN